MKKRFIIPILFTIMLFLSVTSVNAEDCSSYAKQGKCENAGCKWTTLTSRRGECVQDTPSGSGKSTKSSGSKHVSCGNISGIPRKIPQLTSYIITVMQVAATVILVILGTIDLFKGISSSKEEEIKKGQQVFVKRLITGALIFFVVLVVKLLVGAVADASSSNIVSCMDCFISDDCD